MKQAVFFFTLCVLCLATLYLACHTHGETSDTMFQTSLFSCIGALIVGSDILQDNN